MRRWFRFRLRHLLIVMTLIASGLGFVAFQMRPYQRQAAALDELRAAGYEVHTADCEGYLKLFLAPDEFVDAKMVMGFENSFQPGHAQQFARLRELSALIMIRTGISDDDLVFIESLPHLQHLQIEEPSLTDRCLHSVATCRELTYLQLMNTHVGPSIDVLAPLTSLKSLDLCGTRLDDAGLAGAVERFPRLTFIDIGHTRVTPDGTRALAQLRELEELRVWHLAIDVATRQTLVQRHVVIDRPGQLRYF